MTPPRRAGEAGAAVVELALVLPVLLGVLALVVPLGMLLQAQLLLGRTAGDAVRFATSRADQPRDVVGSRVQAGALPSEAQVQAEAARAWAASRGRVFLPVSVTVAASAPGRPFRTDDPACPSLRRRTVTVSTTVDLGPVASLLGPPTKTLSATATSCEE